MSPVEHELAGTLVVVGPGAVTVTVEVGVPQRLAGVAAARTGRTRAVKAAMRENIVLYLSAQRGLLC